MSDDRIIIKTYVWHGDKCFFVSTINRDSSTRYNETLVWEYDYEKAERGEMLHTATDMTGSIRRHQRIVECLSQIGTSEDVDPS